jgi:hypothetical protein
LTCLAKAEKLSFLKTFTMTKFARDASAVLDECGKSGEVKIRRRNGKTYTVQPDTPPDKMRNLPDFAARMKKIFPEPIPPSGRFDR